MDRPSGQPASRMAAAPRLFGAPAGDFTKRGLCGYSTIPIACAPLRAAASASCTRVNPQDFDNSGHIVSARQIISIRQARYQATCSDVRHEAAASDPHSPRRTYTGRSPRRLARHDDGRGSPEARLSTPDRWRPQPTWTKRANNIPDHVLQEGIGCISRSR